MNKFFLSLLAFLCSFNFINAQETIRIPDVAFEETLIDLKIDTNGLNGTILVSDAKYVVNLNIFDPLNNKDLPNVHSKIKDLTGIEHFPNLKKLVCYGNEIKTINLSENTQITFLNCSDNNITSLDLTNNEKLRFISCDTNKIRKLTLGNKPDLNELYCNGNNLTSIDLKGCIKLDALDISGNKIKKALVNASDIKTIPEGWFKDESTIYVTSLKAKTVPNVNTTIINNTTKNKVSINNNLASETKPATEINNEKNTATTETAEKTYSEDFKKNIVSEFEKAILNDTYLQEQIKILSKKHNLNELKISEWLNTYSELIKLKNKS